MAEDRTGKLEPFYMRGIETGFWDTRKDTTNYDRVFETYHKMGANAAMFMIHWINIEPQDGKFDFSFTDNIVAKAQSHSVKIVWVLFMHEHSFDMQSYHKRYSDSKTEIYRNITLLWKPYCI